MSTLSEWWILGPSIGDVIIIFSGEYKSWTVNTDTNTMRITFILGLYSVLDSAPERMMQ